MGACSASMSRSDRMMIVHPSATAADAASQRASMALFSAPGPSAGLKTEGNVADLAYPSSMARIFASSALVRTGRWSLSWRHCWGVSSNRLPSQPMNDSTEVTSSSRMASRGGLLTCANSCLKYQKRSGASSESTARGVSLPIEPTASAPFSAMGARIMLVSSRV